MPVRRRTTHVRVLQVMVLLDVAQVIAMLDIARPYFWDSMGTKAGHQKLTLIRRKE